MILGPQPQATMMQQPMQGQMPQTSPLVQTLLAQSGSQPQQSSVPGQATGLNAGLLAQMFAKQQQGQAQSGLLGGARPGSPDWLNAARFGMSGAQGVNPWTYGMGGQQQDGNQPGTTAPTDTAGNYQV